MAEPEGSPGESPPAHSEPGLEPGRWSTLGHSKLAAEYNVLAKDVRISSLMRAWLDRTGRRESVTTEYYG